MVCNQRDLDHRIWRSLDRAMVRYKWLKLMPLSTFSHLPFVSSDNCPLLLEMVERQHGSIKDLSFYITRWRINLFLALLRIAAVLSKTLNFYIAGWWLQVFTFNRVTRASLCGFFIWDWKGRFPLLASGLELSMVTFMPMWRSTKKKLDRQRKLLSLITLWITELRKYCIRWCFLVNEA